MRENTLVSVRDLCVEYWGREAPLKAVDRVSFDIEKGEVFGLAGESGSGKSTVAGAMLRILGPPAVITGGQVLIGGQDVMTMGEAALRQLRWRQASMVFQSSQSALNPVLTVGEQLCDTLFAHARMGRKAARQRVYELLAQVGLDEERFDSFPHMLSGGIRQRVVIAMALALSPSLVIMDEATTALDVVVKREILQQIISLKESLGFAVLLITHDLPMLLRIATRIGVLYAGRLAEVGPAATLRASPRHPYTRGLVNAFPALTGPRRQHVAIGGSPPSLQDPPPGCRFHPRCREAVSGCSAETPELIPQAPGHQAACHRT